MARTPYLVVFVVAALFCAGARSAPEPVVVGGYPVPAAEMGEYISGWCDRQGLSVSLETRENEGLTLACDREKEKLLITIRPRSPLASIVELPGVPVSSPFVGKLRSSLAMYVQNLHKEGPETLRDVPRAVFRQKKSIVCLSASVRGETLDFSGFVIDRGGFIISTAHDLDSVQDVTVRLDDGELLAGKIVKRDPQRDLSLIKVEKPLAGAIAVNGGKRKLRMDDRVFSMICPTHRNGMVRVGVVDEPPAISNGQPLWQVNMGVTLGDSGAPVFDPDGKLVGVVKGRYRGGRSRGFLIPVMTLREFLGVGGK